MGEKIFISYKRIDKEKVLPIVEEINQRTGASCWIDLEGIESGDQFERVIIRAIKECEILVFMMTSNSIAPLMDPKTGQPDYSTPSWTEREVKFALDRKKRVIPLSIDGTMVSDCDWLAFNCSGIDSIDYSNKDQREKFFRNLSKWLKKKEAVEVKPTPKVEEKSALKVEEKATPKVEEKPAPKVEEKPESKAEVKSTPKVEEKAEQKAPVIPIPKVQDKTESKVEGKPTSKIEDKPTPREELNPTPRIEVNPTPKVDVNPTPQSKTPPVTPDVPRSKPSFTYIAIAAAIVVGIVALAFGLCSKNTSEESVNPTPVAVEENTSSPALPPTIPETKDAQPTEKEVATSKQTQSSSSIQPTTSSSSANKPATASTQPAQSKSDVEALPTVEGAPEDLDKLGVQYLFGNGVKKDPKQAVIYFNSAAKQGLASAQSHLGSCYYNGTGVSQNYKQAFEWFKKAANKGDVTAQDNLGSCYLLGHGTDQDHSAAVEWYQKAADKGNASAQAHLGSCYLYGQGVSADKEKAIYWYEKAAEQGNNTAKKNLEKLKKSD